MQRDDRSHLLDMVVAARDAVAFTNGLSHDEFAKDRRSRLASLKSPEIVGEAASRLSARTKERHPDIRRREIVGMRNRLVHAHFDIDLRPVRDTADSDLPVLVAELEPLVPPEIR